MRNKQEKIQAGDTYRWFWFGYPDSVTEKGKILDLNCKDFLKFTFGEAGVVSVKIFEDLGNVFLELIQDEIPHPGLSQTNYHVECKTGWTFYLANLNSILQGGVDLRNRNKDLMID